MRKKLEPLILLAIIATLANFLVRRPEPAATSTVTTVTLEGLRAGDPATRVCELLGEPMARMTLPVTGGGPSPYRHWSYPEGRSVMLMNDVVLSIISTTGPIECPQGQLPGPGSLLEEALEAYPGPLRSDGVSVVFPSPGGLGELTVHHDKGYLTQVVLSGAIKHGQIVP